MRTYVSPIGFNTTSVTRTILNHGVESGDVIVLIRPAHETDVERATEAIEDVERMLHEIEPDVSTLVERVPHDDFPTAVMRCSEILRDAERPVVNFGGGARDVLVPLTIATVAHAPEINSILGYSDLDGKVREWELPRVTTTPSKGAYETLSLIERAENEVSISKLDQESQRAKSTITRHINQLEDEGFVTSRTDDRAKHVTITLGGRLCLASKPLP